MGGAKGGEMGDGKDSQWDFVPGDERVSVSRIMFMNKISHETTLRWKTIYQRRIRCSHGGLMGWSMGALLRWVMLFVRVVGVIISDIHVSRARGGRSR